MVDTSTVGEWRSRRPSPIESEGKVSPTATTTTDPAYGLEVTRRIHVGVAVGLCAAALTVVGALVVLGLFAGEDWCQDRRPWWGPPQDANSTCSGHHWERAHPGEFPWTLPR